MVIKQREFDMKKGAIKEYKLVGNTDIIEFEKTINELINRWGFEPHGSVHTQIVRGKSLLIDYEVREDVETFHQSHSDEFDSDKYVCYYQAMTKRFVTSLSDDED